MTEYYIRWEADRNLPAFSPNYLYSHDYVNEEDSE